MMLSGIRKYWRRSLTTLVGTIAAGALGFAFLRPPEGPLPVWSPYSTTLSETYRKTEHLVMVYMYMPNDIHHARMWRKISKSRVIGQAIHTHNVAFLMGNVLEDDIDQLRLRMRDTGYATRTPLIAIFRKHASPDAVVSGYIPDDRVDTTVVSAIEETVNSTRMFSFYVVK